MGVENNAIEPSQPVRFARYFFPLEGERAARGFFSKTPAGQRAPYNSAAPPGVTASRPATAPQGHPWTPSSTLRPGSTLGATREAPSQDGAEVPPPPDKENLGETAKRHGERLEGQAWPGTENQEPCDLPFYGHYDVTTTWDFEDPAVDTTTYSPNLGFTRLHYAFVPYSKEQPVVGGAALRVKRGGDNRPSSAFPAAPLADDEFTPGSETWRYFSSLRVGDVVEIHQIAEWAAKLHPRSIQDLKPVAVLLQGLLQDLLADKLRLFSEEVVMLQDQLRETQEAAETEISELRKQIEQMSTEQTAKARKDAVISRFQGVLDKARQMESQREVSSFKVEVRKKLEQKEAAQQRLRDNYKDAVRELEQVKLEKATLEREAGSAKEQMRTFADAKAALDADCRRARAEAQAAMAMVRNLEELLDQQNSKVEELAFSALRPALQEELMKVRGGQELAGWMKESGLVASSCALALKPAREVAEALRELSRGAAGEILELASAHDVSALLGQICHDSVEQAADLVALIRSGQVQRIAAIFSMMDEADGARLADRVSYDLAPEAFTNGDVAAAKAQGFGDAAKRSEVLRAMVDKFRRAEAMLRQGDDEFDALMWSLQHGTATGAAGQAAGSPTGEDADDAATQRTMSSRQRRLAGAMSHSARTSSTAGSIDLGTEGGHGMEAAIHKIGSIASELAAAVADMDAGTIAEILRGKNAALKAGVLAALDPEKAAAVSAYDNRQAEMQARLAKDDAAALRREHPEYENLQNLLATLEEADTTAEVRDLLPEVLGKAHEIYNVTLSVRQVIEDEEREKDTELGADEASMLFLSSMEVLGSTEIAFDRWLNGGDDDDDGTRAPQEPEVLATPDKTAAGGKARANTMTVSAAHKAKRDAVADLARRAAISTGKQCKEAMAKGVRQIDEMAMATPIIGTVDDKEQTVGVVTSTHLPGHVCPCCDSEVSSRPVAGDQLEIAGRIAEAVGKALTNALNSEAKLMKRVEEVLLGPSGMQLEIPAEIKDAQKLRTALERVVQKVSLRIQDSSQLRKQLAEIKSYSKPPRTVVVVMLLAFMLLSEPGLSQAAPGFVVPADPSRLWMYLRRSIVIERSTKRYLPRRMGTIIRSLREKPLASAVQRAGEEMMAGVGHEDAVKASQCLALIRMWGLAVLNMGMVQEQIMKLLDE